MHNIYFALPWLEFINYILKSLEGVSSVYLSPLPSTFVFLSIVLMVLIWRFRSILKLRKHLRNTKLDTFLFVSVEEQKYFSYKLTSVALRQDSVQKEYKRTKSILCWFLGI